MDFFFFTEVEPDKAFQLAEPAEEIAEHTSKMLVCGQSTGILGFRNNPERKRLFLCCSIFMKHGASYIKFVLKSCMI